MTTNQQNLETMSSEECAKFHADPVALMMWAFDWDEINLENWQIEMLTQIKSSGVST